VPVFTVLVSMLLALVCVGWLIFFINHISQSISVNHIVDRIAGETERAIDELMPYPRGQYKRPDNEAFREGRELIILSGKSGYIRFVDVEFLVDCAKSFGVQAAVLRRVGQFSPAGAPLLRVVAAGRVTPEREARLLSGIDIGPVRTMQQDVEFGVIQIVDIALRAISPAVNDPTTAINCIDQLARVMIVWRGRAPPPTAYHRPPHVPRLIVPWIGYEGLLDTAFEQIRHYAKGDVAVSLRLLRAFGDMIAAGAFQTERETLLLRARRVVAGCELPEEELEPLRRRLAGLEAAQAA
jgi:uncharacterized membrane protein